MSKDEIVMFHLMLIVFNIQSFWFLSKCGLPMGAYAVQFPWNCLICEMLQMWWWYEKENKLHVDYLILESEWSVM